MYLQRVTGLPSLCFAVISAFLAGMTAGPGPVSANPAFERINHVLVIYLENRSFDNLYGLFPGADGIANAGAAATQVDREGRVYDALPPVMDTSARPPAVDARFPAVLPNRPFPIDRFVPIGEKTGDLVHRFYQQQEQINGGRMNRFAAVSDAGGLAMGYYDGSGMELWRIAQEYTLADNFFHAAFGGSFLNHFWLVCACTPRYENPPAELLSELDAAGHLIKDRPLTPDGYAVNTIQSTYQPHSPAITDPTRLLPPQDMPTIGDRLSERGVSWAWYSGGWSDAVAGHADPTFQYHHHPFAYFRRYGDGTPARAEHLKDAADLMAAIGAGTLPAVAFFKPIGSLNQHPGYADVTAGDRHTAELIRTIQQSPLWQDTLIVVTFDENGGYWDHVPPPAGDRWGPGMRVPTLIVSPFARLGFVDHTQYDTMSILKFIEERFDLPPLGSRDAAANNLANALQF